MADELCEETHLGEVDPRGATKQLLMGSNTTDWRVLVFSKKSNTFKSLVLDCRFYWKNSPTQYLKSSCHRALVKLAAVQVTFWIHGRFLSFGWAKKKRPMSWRKRHSNENSNLSQSYCSMCNVWKYVDRTVQHLSSFTKWQHATYAMKHSACPLLALQPNLPQTVPIPPTSAHLPRLDRLGPWRFDFLDHPRIISVQTSDWSWGLMLVSNLCRTT